jgi:hypothetical protein
MWLICYLDMPVGNREYTVMNTICILKIYWEVNYTEGCCEAGETVADYTEQEYVCKYGL